MLGVSFPRFVGITERYEYLNVKQSSIVKALP